MLTQCELEDADTVINTRISATKRLAPAERNSLPCPPCSKCKTLTLHDTMDQQQQQQREQQQPSQELASLGSFAALGLGSASVTSGTGLDAILNVFNAFVGRDVNDL